MGKGQALSGKPEKAHLGKRDSGHVTASLHPAAELEEEGGPMSWSQGSSTTTHGRTGDPSPASLALEEAVMQSWRHSNGEEVNTGGDQTPPLTQCFGSCPPPAFAIWGWLSHCPASSLPVVQNFAENLWLSTWRLKTCSVLAPVGSNAFLLFLFLLREHYPEEQCVAEDLFYKVTAGISACTSL